MAPKDTLIRAGEVFVAVGALLLGSDLGLPLLGVAGVVPDDDARADPLEPRGGVLADDAAEADRVPGRHRHHRLGHRHRRRARQRLGLKPKGRRKFNTYPSNFTAKKCLVPCT